MSLGALIAAYQEDDEGGLRALLPLAGQTLVEYQVRCAAAAEASPILVMVERVPPRLQEAFERLRADGLTVVAVGDAQEAASRFEPAALIMLMGDGVVPTPEIVAQLSEAGRPVVGTVPDDALHDAFERVDAEWRWAGLAVIDGQLLTSTAAMLGDWDLQSTLLRRALQDGAERIALSADSGEPLLVERAGQLDGFERAMVVASKGARRDFASRYLLAPLEDFATAQLVETAVRPVWLVWGALSLTLAASAAFLLGWPLTALLLLLLSTPLDLVAARLGTLRLRPLPKSFIGFRMLWPAAGLAIVSLGWWTSKGSAGWGGLACALTAAAFAEAARIEAPAISLPGETWLFSRRNAVLLGVLFAPFGAWGTYLAAMSLYAGTSFFLLQNVRHRESLN